MALSSVSVKDLALFWRKDWQKKLLTKKPGISHFLLNLADFVKHTLKGALHDKFHYLSFAQDIWQNYIFFPDPVNQTLL